MRYTTAYDAASAILERNCGSCHGKSLQEAPCGLRFDETDDRGATGLLVPLSFAESPFSQAILEGRMPPPGVEPRPTPDEIDPLRELVDNPELWSGLPPDGHSMSQAYADARANACPAGAPSAQQTRARSSQRPETRCGRAGSRGAPAARAGGAQGFFTDSTWSLFPR